jgi:hypothetical protein
MDILRVYVRDNVPDSSYTITFKFSSKEPSKWPMIHKRIISNDINGESHSVTVNAQAPYQFPLLTSNLGDSTHSLLEVASFAVKEKNTFRGADCDSEHYLVAAKVR